MPDDLTAQERLRGAYAQSARRLAAIQTAARPAEAAARFQPNPQMERLIALSATERETALAGSPSLRMQFGLYRADRQAYNAEERARQDKEGQHADTTH
jgi:hypothetical protein